MTEAGVTERLVDMGFTLLVFDYDGGPMDSVAFKTTLTPLRLVETTQALLARWKFLETESALVMPDYVPWRKIINVGALEVLGTFLREQLPVSRGYALIVGDAPWYSYIASANRRDMATMLRDYLLPEWELLIPDGSPRLRS